MVFLSRQKETGQLNYLRHTYSAHIYVHPHIPSHQTEQIRPSLSAQDCLDHNEYIIGPFSVNNMAVPTRYVALPDHFQLGEHGARAGLVENLNAYARVREREGTHEKSEGG